MDTISTETNTPSATHGADRFLLRQVVSEIRDSVAGSHVALSDIRQSGALELAIGNTSPSEDPTRLPGVWPLILERIEGPIRARAVPTAVPGASRFRYFLDGSQVTLPVWRVGLVPIVFSVTSAGVLQRTDRGEPLLRSELLAMERTWILPLGSNDPRINALAVELDRRGDARLVDPLTSDRGEPFENYDVLLGHYGFLLANAQTASNRVRANLERQVFNDWQFGVGEIDQDAWIVVDGRLLDNVPRAVGLVKTLLTQHLAADEAVALFDLPQGHRTTAFRHVHNREDEQPGQRDGRARTMWYLRFWDSSGMDARHSLARIEVAHDVDSTAEIDEISSWLLSERLPRATADPRWPTLLYPIHLLERMLKRRMSSVTSGWPS